jgi:hypothetical protein
VFIEEEYQSPSPQQEDSVVDFPVEEESEVPFSEPAAAATTTTTSLLESALPAVKNETMSEDTSVFNPATAVPETLSKMAPDYQMMKEYLKEETVGAKMAHILPDEWEVHTSHDDIGFLEGFGDPVGSEEEVLMLQEILETVQTGGPRVHVEGDPREDFIDQFFSGGVVGGEELILEGGGGELALADIQGHVPPLSYGAEELTPWEIADRDFIELNDFLFPNNEALPSWPLEPTIQLQERQSADLLIQGSEQGSARRRSMLQMRGSRSGPVPRPITSEYSFVSGQSSYAMNMPDLTGSSSATTVSRPEARQHEQRSADRLREVQSASLQPGDEVSSTSLFEHWNSMWSVC